MPSEPKPQPKPTKSESLGVTPNMGVSESLVVLMCGQWVRTVWLALNLTLLVSNHLEGLVIRVAECHPRVSDFLHFSQGPR